MKKKSEVESRKYFLREYQEKNPYMPDLVVEPNTRDSNTEYNSH